MYKIGYENEVRRYLLKGDEVSEKKNIYIWTDADIGTNGISNIHLYIIIEVIFFVLFIVIVLVIIVYLLLNAL